MTHIGRILEVWEAVPEESREPLTQLIESIAVVGRECRQDPPEARKTVVVENTHAKKPRPKRCPDCAREIPGPGWNHCVDCGCMLPEWVW